MEWQYSFWFLLAVLLLTVFFAVWLYRRNRKLHREMREIAGKDVLTDILNKRSFSELCAAQIERSLRVGGESFLVMFDLDFFKAVNDRYGHLAGDKVLVEVSQRVKRVIRPYDLFGRFGGEEFILLMSDIDTKSAVSAAERIRADISSAPVEFEGLNVAVSASFGIARAAPQHTMHMAIKLADEALYRAKNTGRNKVVLYEDPHPPALV
jgi:diguanylate cyclase (GGDEF)-like protein